MFYGPIWLSQKAFLAIPQMAPQNRVGTAAPPASSLRADPADYAQGFVWLCLVFAWSVLIFSVDLVEGWPDTLRRAVRRSGATTVPGSVLPAATGLHLWPAPL